MQFQLIFSQHTVSSRYDIILTILLYILRNFLVNYIKNLITNNTLGFLTHKTLILTLYWNPGKHCSNVLLECLFSTCALACSFFFTILIVCLHIVHVAIVFASLIFEAILPLSSPMPSSLFFFCFAARKSFFDWGILRF